MFETIVAAPPDAILGLTEAFKADPNPHKINLGVGVYKDESGQTPILRTVKLAEERLIPAESTKSYLGIDGTAAYSAAVQRLIFGEEHPILTERRAVTAQTPGGTGALRVAADFMVSALPDRRIWLSDPTWPNHPNIFTAAGLPLAHYPYFSADTNDLKFSAMLAALHEIPTGDVIVLHGCCHNPTGVDLTPEQWSQVAHVVAERGLLPLIDFAYQGFSEGLREDTAGVLIMADAVPELMIASSYSKNFGLYSERIGALTVVSSSAKEGQAISSRIKKVIRSNYSNPPAHGSAIVTMILNDSELRAQWEGEVVRMRNRINDMRHLFVESLNEMGVEQDFSFIARQRGMFSFSGLTPDHVQALRARHSVYVVGSGRINVAGMTARNMDYLCSAIADVLKG